MSFNRSRYQPLPTDVIPDPSALGGSTSSDDSLAGNGDPTKRGLQERQYVPLSAHPIIMINSSGTVCP